MKNELEFEFIYNFLKSHDISIGEIGNAEFFAIGQKSVSGKYFCLNQYDIWCIESVSGNIYWTRCTQSINGPKNKKELARFAAMLSHASQEAIDNVK